MTVVMTLLISRSQASEPLATRLSNDANSKHALLDTVSSPGHSSIASIDFEDQLTPSDECKSEIADSRLDGFQSGISLSKDSSGLCDNQVEQMWMISTRHLSMQACNANLNSVDFRVSQLDHCGNRQPDQFESFLSNLSPNRTLVIHVHGNRLTEAEANARGRFVYRCIKPHAAEIPMDLLIFSWPAEQRGSLIHDGRTKALITEAESLYFATLLRELMMRDIPVAIVAYSFGCRVVSGGLHCLAGGSLSGRQLPTEPIVGGNIVVGLIAPAVQSDWLGNGRYHGMSTQNTRDLAILYNSRDAVLKRFWLVEPDSRGPALGYAGPTRIAPGFDGLPVPLTKCDCARYLGLAHNEQEYYTDGCNAGRRLATLIRNTR